MSKRSKECDITPKVKQQVWDRDGHCCIVCGNPKAMPNAHYIPRSDGGLGIKENIVTLCMQCHHDYDNGGKRKEYGLIIKDYLDGWYPNFTDEQRRYDKYRWLNETIRESKS